MARPNVPEFGKWGEDDVPYTVYFDKARKNRGGKMINPNDPQENPEMFPGVALPARAPSPVPAPGPVPPSRTRGQTEDPVGRTAVKPSYDHRMSKEDGDFRQFADSPMHDNLGRKPLNEQQRYGGRGAASGRTVRPNAGRGNASPAWEGKNLYDSAHGTPGRSRLRPVTRGDETPDRGAAVPRFGDWDEKNPQSADNYTHIFNKVREQRHVGANTTGTPTHPVYNRRMQQPNNDQKASFYLILEILNAIHSENAMIYPCYILSLSFCRGGASLGVGRK